jgi:hypothetical protein
LNAGALRIRHKELAKLVAHAPVATKLSANLDSLGMARDAYVRWEHYWPCGGTLYTRSAALTVGVNVFALLLTALIPVWSLLSRTKFRSAFQKRKWGPWLVAAPAFAGIAVYLLVLPKADASSFRVTRTLSVTVRSQFHYLSQMIEMHMADSNVNLSALASPRPPDSAELDRVLRSVAQEYQGASPHYPGEFNPLANYFTGDQVRFEDSPGNISLRPVGTDDYELVWHDLDGAEAITNRILVNDNYFSP